MRRRKRCRAQKNGAPRSAHRTRGALISLAAPTPLLEPDRVRPSGSGPFFPSPRSWRLRCPFRSRGYKRRTATPPPARRGSSPGSRPLLRRPAQRTAAPNSSKGMTIAIDYEPTASETDKHRKASFRPCQGGGSDLFRASVDMAAAARADHFERMPRVPVGQPGQPTVERRQTPVATDREREKMGIGHLAVADHSDKGRGCGICRGNIVLPEHVAFETAHAAEKGHGLPGSARVGNGAPVAGDAHEPGLSHRTGRPASALNPSETRRAPPHGEHDSATRAPRAR